MTDASERRGGAGTAQGAARPTCGTCPYWLAYGWAEPYPPEGECRQHAPRSTIDGNDWAITRANDFCGDHPDFPAWLEAKDIHSGPQIERRVYHKSSEHETYRHARFGDRHGSLGSSFEFDGHRWSYRYTSFDDDGDYDLIWRPRPISRQPRPVPAGDGAGPAPEDAP